MSTTHSKLAPAGTMTYEEFLDWADEDTLAEWVDGQVEMTSPASLEHQEIKTFVAGILLKYARFHRAGKVLDAPFQMKLPQSGREPDVLFVAQAHLDRLKRTYLDGPADLAVEVISPDSITRDRQNKVGEYQRGSVAEYWLLDPVTQEAEFYQLNAQGTYQRVLPDAQGIYHAQAVPGFWLNVTWLWQNPLPDEETVILTVIGQPYADYLKQQIRQLGL